MTEAMFRDAWIDVPFEEAVAFVWREIGADAVALVSTTRRHAAVRLTGSSSLAGGPSDVPLTLHSLRQEAVFEMRAFRNGGKQPPIEFRWRSDGSQESVARIALSQDGSGSRAGTWSRSGGPERIEVKKILTRRYVLWGKAESISADASWREYSASQIGSLWIPSNPEFAAPGRDYVALSASEIVGGCSATGAAVVVEEILRGFQPVHEDS